MRRQPDIVFGIIIHLSSRDTISTNPNKIPSRRRYTSLLSPARFFLKQDLDASPYSIKRRINYAPFHYTQAFSRSCSRSWSLGASSVTYTMVIRAETTSRLTFDNNAAASEKAACRGGGGAAAGVATRPGEPRLGRGITGEPGTRSTPPPRCSPPPTRDRTTRVVDISDASCRRCPPAAFRRRRFPLSSASRKKIAEKRIQVFFFLLFFFCEGGGGGGRNFNRSITCNLTQIRRRKFS